MFDPQTHLPTRIRTLDYDNVWGDSTYDLTLADWRTLGGVQTATSQRYELNGKVVTEIKITDVRVLRTRGGVQARPEPALRVERQGRDRDQDHGCERECTAAGRPLRGSC